MFTKVCFGISFYWVLYNRIKDSHSFFSRKFKSYKLKIKEP